MATRGLKKSWRPSRQKNDSQISSSLIAFQNRDITLEAGKPGKNVIQGGKIRDLVASHRGDDAVRVGHSLTKLSDSLALSV